MLKKLINLGTDFTTDFQLATRIRLSNIVAIVLCIFVMFYGALWTFLGEPLLAIVCYSVSFLYFLTPFLNKLNLVNLSRTLMLFYGSITIAFFSISLGKNLAVNIFFILQVTYPFLFFLIQERWKIIGNIILTSIVLGICIFINEYSPLLLYSVSGKFLSILNHIYLFSIIITQGVVVLIFFIMNNNSEKQILDASNHLIQAKKLSTLGQLASSITHELNQPLNSITIICQSILRDIKKGNFENESFVREMDDVILQIKRMNEIIEHMSLYSRKSENIEQENMDVSLPIKSVLNLINQQLKHNNISLTTKFTSNMPFVRCNQIMLEQVLMNIIINARDALDESSIQNKIIEIKTLPSEDRKHVIIEVMDNGGGICDEIRKQIFDPFFTTKKPGIGTGLGLAISSQIIKDHSGEFLIKSSSKEGTVFQINLPANPLN